MKLRLARHPNRLDAALPIILEELLELELGGRQEATSAMIELMKDLHENGRQCRYLGRLKGPPLWELKPASRGGLKGGSRVYLFLFTQNPASGVPEEQAGIVNCEVKDGVEADTAKLKVALEVLVAYKKGIPVFEES